MSRIFISYSRNDQEFVQHLVTDLALHLPDVRVFYDMLISPGSSWAQTIASEIEQADVVLAVLSPEYLTSPWCSQELNVALERQLHEDGRLIPLLVRSCNPTGFLALLRFVDFTEDYEAAFARLIWGITGERPGAAKGEEPGVPMKAIDPVEVETLRCEVQRAVELFKSRDEATSSLQPSHPTPRTTGKRRCFVIMPFADPDLQIVYEDFVKPTLTDGCNLDCERGDDVFGSNVIMEDILKSIRSADVIIADLTKKNANVFYEVGICHAMGKRVLLLAQSNDDVPFDLRHLRVLRYEYSPRGCTRLKEHLKDNVNAILKEL